MADYKWSTFRYSVPAQEVGERIEKLAEKGDVTASAIVDDARPKDSTLHPIFEWDDGTAAEEYRKYQAKVMLSSLSITLTSVGGDSKPMNVAIRAFSNVTAKGIGNTAVYVRTEDAMQNEEQKDVILANALREVEAFSLKYSNLGELESLINSMREEADKIRKKLKRESRPHGSARRQSQTSARV